MVGLVLLDNLWQVWYSHKFELGSSPLLCPWFLSLCLFLLFKFFLMCSLCVQLLSQGQQALAFARLQRYVKATNRSSTGPAAFVAALYPYSRVDASLAHSW
ncbi:hypothetical protein VTP01DRAFT_6067 [Rhizomucor pusillus]|uniref:uncharacterized protein n=1 Tax=Rhizomucor pusillus TaxID=4840 RepID=UPI003743C40D